MRPIMAHSSTDFGRGTRHQPCAEPRVGRGPRGEMRVRARTVTSAFYRFPRTCTRRVWSIGRYMRLLTWMQPRSRPAALRTLVTLALVAGLVTVVFLPAQPGGEDLTTFEATLNL